MNSITSLIGLLTLLALAPPPQHLFAEAHMALWHPSVYGFNSGDLQTPLSSKSFDQWWFHGYANDKPQAVMTIKPGSNLTVQIACSKDSTSWGSNPSKDACPGDAGSYHAGGQTGSASGWSGNSASHLTGCALAIAYKKDAKSTKPSDFTVFSTQANCVRQRDTTFAVPANMPACPPGGCTCAWFWQGQDSANEMYMNGFRCNVSGGTTGSIPVPVKPRKNAIRGATQPMYWANSNSNVADSISYDSKPSYNSKWGWKNGAQTAAFYGTSSTSYAVDYTASTDSDGDDASSYPTTQSRPAKKCRRKAAYVHQ